MPPGRNNDQPFTGTVTEVMVRAQLERLLASEMFSRSERLSRFLRFIVEQALNGQTGSLKEPVLASELYGRATDFSATTDPIVRVDARRLRDKLREYYSEFPGDPVVITLPRGGYVPAFQMNAVAPQANVVRPCTTVEPSALRSSRHREWKRRRYGALVALTLTAAVTLWFTMPGERHAAPKLVPVTSYPGNESWPALSPDGNFVAFVCTGAAAGGSSDICVKAVGSESVQRVVQTPEAESRPAWSPDGREIAFVRNAGGKELGVFVVSRIGGVERRVSETGSGVVWTPDGKSVLIRDRLRPEPAPFAIFHLDLVTLERRPVTQPQAGGGDWSFEVSPDGENVAFIRYHRPGVSDLYVAPVKGGEPRRLTDWSTVLWGPAWTPDGSELAYAVDDRLWRIPANREKPGRGSPIPDIPMAAGHVSISRPVRGQPARLAFHAPQQQITLRKVDLTSVDSEGVLRQTVAFAPATRRDLPGPFSHDGARVAFTSTRGSAGYELWVADSNGGQLRQVTSLESNGLMLAHAWSPDMKQLLFETAVQGNSDLYITSVDGGKATRLTESPDIEALGDWSHDGRWIYFTKVTFGMEADIWRIPVNGGPSERLTKGVASEPQESPDGEYIYYVDRPPLDGTVTGRLMRAPANGGDSEFVCDGVSPLYWSLTDKGIYFLREEGATHVIYAYRFDNQKVERIGALPVRVTYRPQGRGRLTVSRDGRWALVNVTDRWEGDLMLVDNFR